MSLTATTAAPGTVVMSRRICSWPIMPTPITPTFTVIARFLRSRDYPPGAPARLIPARPPLLDRASISDSQRPALPQVRGALEFTVPRAADGVRRAHRGAQDDLVAHCFEKADGVRRYAALDPQFVGPELVVGPRRILRLGDIEPVVDHVDDNLKHDGDDARSAGTAGRQHKLAVPEYERRAHRRQRTLHRAGRVGVAAEEAVDIGGAGLGGEVVELVVEQHA